jgi:hypothetical protein
MKRNDFQRDRGRGVLHIDWQAGREDAQGKKKKKKRMVRPEGVEPPTYWFVASCSIQLSYGRTLRGDATL